MKYAVTIQYVITKTYTVDADSPDDAIEWVNENGTPRHEQGVPEDYEDKFLDVEELE